MSNARVMYLATASIIFTIFLYQTTAILGNIVFATLHVSLMLTLCLMIANASVLSRSTS